MGELLQFGAFFCFLYRFPDRGDVQGDILYGTVHEKYQLGEKKAFLDVAVLWPVFLTLSFWHHPYLESVLQVSKCSGLSNCVSFPFHIAFVMLSKKAVRLWGCWESRVTQAQMHLLPLSLWSPSSFYSSDNYHKFGSCQSFSTHHFQYFEWEMHPSKHNIFQDTGT